MNVHISPRLRQNILCAAITDHAPVSSLSWRELFPARYQTENMRKHLVWLCPKFTTSHSVCLICTHTHTKIKISSQAKLETGGNCESASCYTAGRNQTTTKWGVECKLCEPLVTTKRGFCLFPVEMTISKARARCWQLRLIYRPCRTSVSGTFYFTVKRYVVSQLLVVSLTL